MKVVRPTWRYQLNLRSAVAGFRACVLCNDSKLTGVVNVGAVRNEVNSVRANEVVLHVDAIACNIRKRRTLTVYGCAICTIRRGARLQKNQRKGISSVEWQFDNLSLCDSGI